MLDSLTGSSSVGPVFPRRTSGHWKGAKTGPLVIVLAFLSCLGLNRGPWGDDGACTEGGVQTPGLCMAGFDRGLLVVRGHPMTSRMPQ